MDDPSDLCNEGEDGGVAVRRGGAPALHQPVPAGPGVWLRILASGSSGNCSVLVESDGRSRRVWLIDLGLSPKRTRLLLGSSGLELSDVEAVILTHLDSDHWNAAWTHSGAMAAPIRLHRRHEADARRLGVPRVEAFDRAFDLGLAMTRVEPILMSHDDLGATALRFDFSSGACLGFATDLGRATAQFTSHMRGVDVLALESNYCPRMQMASPRPAFLKQRIMNGRGHLSNEEAAQAAGVIRPRLHLVLLHLSRQCNTPERAAEHHAGAAYSLTIAEQHRPTPWVAAPARAPGEAPVRRPRPVVHVQGSLFGPGPKVAM